MNLKITNVRVIPLSIPLKTPMYMSGRCLTHADTLVVCIESDGLVGWGEAASAPRMTGDILPGMVAITEQIFKPMLLGKLATDYKILLAEINKSVYKNTGPKCAIEMALLDLVSRFYNVPVHSLLGNKLRNNFKSIAILGNQTHDEDINEAKELLSQGVDFFKIKVGKSNIKLEIKNTLEIREIIGPTAKLCADANAGLDTASTLEYCRGIKDANLLFLEQPLNDIKDMSNIAQLINIPLCMDESIFTKDDIYAIEKIKAGQGVNLKTIKIGGPLKLIEAAQVCSGLQMSINISSKVSETGIATSAMLHCASVSPNIDWGISTTNQYLIQDVIKGSVSLEPFEVDEYILNQFISGV